jgi:hypothetical protein
MLPLMREPKAPLRTLLPWALIGEFKVAMAQKRYDDAARFAGELLDEDLRRARNPAASADVGEASLLLAQAKAAIGDQAGAHDFARRAVPSLTAGLGADNALTRAAMDLQ